MGTGDLPALALSARRRPWTSLRDELLELDQIGRDPVIPAPLVGDRHAHARLAARSAVIRPATRVSPFS